MTRTLFAAVLLTAALTPSFTLADEPQAPAAPPSILEPARPLLDALARGADECWLWPTGTAVTYCTVSHLWRWWRAPMNKEPVR
jgi:hypothetical protein